MYNVIYNLYIMKTSSLSLLLLALHMGITLLSGADSEQRFNLYGATDVAPFPLSSTLTWPSVEGEGEICLWGEDRFAAMTITIDDNTAQDHTWWLQMAETYDLDLTWFVITNSVTGSTSGGTWSGFQSLVDQGHSVQSHTLSHGLPPSEAAYINEYEDSQATIDLNITGQWAATLAYPNPSGVPVRPDLAKDYYIGARGVVGTPNVANKINYMQTTSTSSRIGVDYIDSILKGTSAVSWLGGDRYTRGWLCTHFHFVTNKPTIEADLEYIDTVRDQIWITSFYNLIRFVQERDTATLTVHSASENEIRFELSDWMDDTIYNYPLTVKFRVSGDWSEVEAKQNGNNLDVRMVENGGNLYAVVQAVPDAGEVILKNVVESNEITWGGLTADSSGHIDTAGWLGWLLIDEQPWLYSYSLSNWIFASDPGPSSSGVWAYIRR